MQELSLVGYRVSLPMFAGLDNSPITGQMIAPDLMGKELIHAVLAAQLFLDSVKREGGSLDFDNRRFPPIIVFDEIGPVLGRIHLASSGIDNMLKISERLLEPSRILTAPPVALYTTAQALLNGSYEFSSVHACRILELYIEQLESLDVELRRTITVEMQELKDEGLFVDKETFPIIDSERDRIIMSQVFSTLGSLELTQIQKID